MISKPSLIILDEPTSGLDSNKAARILQVLKKLTKEGHTVIFTIHQPSGLLYSLLDRLILLNNGQTIYQGTAKAIETYMNSLGVVVPKNSTICDHFMMEISEYKRVNKNYDTPLNVENYVKHNKKPI